MSKGHDFHNITLVVGLNLDSSLFSYDFRATEVLFSQLLQVSGRAGRGDKKGEVLLQTKYPLHAVFQYLIKHNYTGFADLTLNERKIMHLPPFSYYALLRASGVDLARVLTYLNKILHIANLHINLCGIIQYPAVPAVMQRLKKRERGQVLIVADNREKLHLYLNKLIEILQLNPPRFGITWSLDINPLEI